MKLTELFDLAVARKASDIHLATGETARLRIDGALVPVEGDFELAELLEPILTIEGAARLGAGLPVERTVLHGKLAFVAIVFRVGEERLAATFRVLSQWIPALDVIGEDALPLFRRIVETRRGLVLVVGPTGSGKWTTACSIVDAINAEKPARIFVLEGHPSYRFESKQGMVSQIHVGQGCESYVRAMEVAHQADLDVIALDDLPTLEALRQALVMADVGHLVIANLSAPTVVEAVARLLESAGPDEAALRRALADNLIAVTAQRLVPGIEGRGRVPIYEWISNSPAIRAALIEGDLAAAQASDPESRTAQAAIKALVEAGKVAPGTA